MSLDLTKIRHWEIEELAFHALGMTEAEVENAINNEEDPEEGLYSKFGCDFDTFRKVALALLPLTVTARTSRTESLVKGFITKDKQGTRFILKGNIIEEGED